MTPRQLRLLRAAAASLTATLIAAVSHTVGGGAAPHPLLVAALSVFLLPLAALLIGGRARRHRVALTVLVSQAVFHLVFHALGSVSLTGPGGASVGGHSHHLALLGPAPAVATALPDAPMILAHAVAALLTTALLWHGERLLRTIAGWVR